MSMLAQGNALPARDTPGWREIEVIGVDGDALRKTLCQLCGQRRFTAAAAAIQCDEDGRLSGQRWTEADTRSSG